MTDRFNGDVQEMQELWHQLLGSDITEGQLRFWLEKYGAAGVCRAIRRTFAAYNKRGGAMDLDYQTKYCSAVARNHAEKNAQAQSEGTRRKHNYPFVQDGAR